jgi:hypothetical protein
MSKIKIIERPYGKKRYCVYFGKQLMDRFSSKENANHYAAIYLAPPYTVEANKWYS